MCHTSDMCFMYGDHLWPDLDLEPSLVSNIYSISSLPYILGVFGVSFGPKLIILRSLRLVNWKSRFWHLTWPWPDTWPHLENLGGALGSSHRELSNAASLVSLRPFVREIWRGAFNALPPASRGWWNTPATAGLTSSSKVLRSFSIKIALVVMTLSSMGSERYKNQPLRSEYIDISATGLYQMKFEGV